MSRRDDGERLDPFSERSETDPQTVADEIYGSALENLDTGRVVARPLSINEIWADPTQPRRTVPSSIRDEWDGDPDAVVAIFARWKSAVEEALGVPVDIKTMMTGDAPLFELSKPNQVITQFFDLVTLAGSIRDTQLNHPIGVTAIPGGHLVVFGERRWLAYHLLNIVFPDETYGRIPARVLDENAFDLAKAQAAENTARSDLNAIAKTRQFAKLLIAATDGEDVSFNTYSSLVLPGGCDRRYYAQVANGNVHRIPRGLGPKFEQALNISVDQMRRYRNLLKLTSDDEVNDGIWTLADDNDWAEGFLRDIAGIPTNLLRQILYTVPIGTVYEMEERLRDAIADVQRHLEREREAAKFEQDKARGLPQYTPPAKQAPSPSVQETPTETPTWYIGDRVITRTGREGRVVGFSGRLVNVRDANGVQQHDRATLSKPPYRQQEQTHVEEIEEPEKATLEPHEWLGKRVKSIYAKWEATVIQIGVNGRLLICQTTTGETHKVPPSGLEVLPEGHVDVIGLLRRHPSSDVVESPTDVETVDETQEEDVSDNGHSADGDEAAVVEVKLMVRLPEHLQATIRYLAGMARIYNHENAQNTINDLDKMTTRDVADLAGMSEQAVQQTLQGYEAHIGNLLEMMLQNVEDYTRWIRELVADARGDGG